MSLEETYYPEVRFGGFTRVDGTIAFYTRVAALTTDGSVIVDFGCGRGIQEKTAVHAFLRRFCGRAQRVIGLDVDPVGRENEYIDEFHLLTDGTWPLQDSSVDLCFADHVLEHLSTPDRFFAEASRVLKPGGIVCIRTPNRHSYVALAARIIPKAFHSNILKRAQPARQEQDVFPAYYRANTCSVIRKLFDQYKFEHAVFTHEPEPGYLHFSKCAYALGVLLQKITPTPFRSVIFAFGRVLGDKRGL
jgi:SAM-dependent methyltransferase